VRRKNKEITDKAVLHEILRNSEVCRIAFFDDEYPYIVPMNYGYKDDCLFFHCAPEGRKLDLIRKNNNVGFEIEHSHEIIKDDLSCKWTTKYRSIIGVGEIEIITNKTGKREGLDCIMKQHGKTDNEYNNSALDFIVVLKLHIKNMSGKQSRVNKGAT